MEVTIVKSLIVPVETLTQHIDLNKGDPLKSNGIVQTKYKEINL